jgi:hypothetical protein
MVWVWKREGFCELVPARGPSCNAGTQLDQVESGGPGAAESTQLTVFSLGSHCLALFRNGKANVALFRLAS